MRLKPEQILIGVDTREQGPYSEAELGFSVKPVALDTGDYSVLLPDLTPVLAIERKSLADLVASVTQGRERFNREVQRLRAYRYAYLVVEGSASQIVNHEYRSKAHANSILGSLARFQMRGISVMLADNRKAAAYMVGRLCWFVAEEICSYAQMICEHSCKNWNSANLLENREELSTRRT